MSTLRNSIHPHNRHGEDEENFGFNSEPLFQTNYGIKPMSEADAERTQIILTIKECESWDEAFKQFWAKRGDPFNYSSKGFQSLKFGRKGRPKKDNFEDFEEDYVESLTRVK